MKALSLSLTFVVLLSPRTPAQITSSPLAEVHERLSALSRELERKSEAEQALLRRVLHLERLLAEEREETKDRIQALENRTDRDALDQELEDLVEHTVTSERFLREAASIQVGGYVDLEFRRDNGDGSTTFDQHRLILQLEGDVLEDAISFRSELEIEGGGAGASFLSGNEIVLEYGEIHFQLSQGFNLKAGALLVPFGRFNRLHDSPLRDLTDRPLVNQFIVPTTWTDAGIGVYGNFDLGFANLDYDVILSNGLDADFSSTPGGGLRGNRSSFRRDNNDNKQVTGRLGVTPYLAFLDSTNLGFSFAHGRYDARGRRDLLMFGLDWTLKKGPFEFLGEYAMVDLERGDAERALGAPGRADGFYLQLNYHFFPDSWRGTTPLFTDESTFTLVFRYGSIDTDHSARGIDRGARGAAFRDDLVRYTVGLNFRPIERSVIKFEYQFLAENGIDAVDNNRFVMSFATYF